MPSTHCSEDKNAFECDVVRMLKKKEVKRDGSDDNVPPYPAAPMSVPLHHQQQNNLSGQRGFQSFEFQQINEHQINQQKSQNTVNYNSLATTPSNEGPLPMTNFQNSDNQSNSYSLDTNCNLQHLNRLFLTNKTYSPSTNCNSSFKYITSSSSSSRPPSSNDLIDLSLTSGFSNQQNLQILPYDYHKFNKHNNIVFSGGSTTSSSTSYNGKNQSFCNVFSDTLVSSKISKNVSKNFPDENISSTTYYDCARFNKQCISSVFGRNDHLTRFSCLYEKEQMKSATQRPNDHVRWSLIF
ncbi:hypothetical protein HELRODRAFT_168036 [Helobdella robusta]|uniref:Uncharacterized protein n=1 Tax=Helobdella robusta TaxID=6412 RepID=T1F034_HELRO|nr:hypothetical protein HELRODRAFT_168036 [Helobdella robusta]ESO10168.1 hypothetical protein HELRODRAFT_168036 [Helobdella robusta]